jgi:hypothetical protein
MVATPGRRISLSDNFLTTVHWIESSVINISGQNAISCLSQVTLIRCIAFSCMTLLEVSH